MRPTANRTVCRAIPHDQHWYISTVELRINRTLTFQSHRRASKNAIELQSYYPNKHFPTITTFPQSAKSKHCVRLTTLHQAIQSRRNMFYYRPSPIYHHPILSLLTPYAFEAATSSHPCATGSCKVLRNPRHSYSRFQYHVENKEDVSIVSLDLPGVKDNEVKVEFHSGVVKSKPTNTSSSCASTRSVLISKRSEPTLQMVY